MNIECIVFHENINSRGATGIRFDDRNNKKITDFLHSSIRSRVFFFITTEFPNGLKKTIFLNRNK